MPGNYTECLDERRVHSLGFKLRSAREGYTAITPKQNRELVCHRRAVHVLANLYFWTRLVQARATQGAEIS
jgi:hypothetical protein